MAKTTPISAAKIDHAVRIYRCRFDAWEPPPDGYRWAGGSSEQVLHMFGPDGPVAIAFPDLPEFVECKAMDLASVLCIRDVHGNRIPDSYARALYMEVSARSRWPRGGNDAA